jgi:hypothetical protein
MLPFSVREREGNEWAAMYQGAGGFFGFFFSWVNLNDQQKGNKLQSLDSQLEVWFGWVHHQEAQIRVSPRTKKSTVPGSSSDHQNYALFDIMFLKVFNFFSFKLFFWVLLIFFYYTNIKNKF